MPPDRRHRATAPRLGLDPARTVVLEDSAAGAAAGEAAGAYVIGAGPRALDTAAPVVVSGLRGPTWHDGVLDLGAARLPRS